MTWPDRLRCRYHHVSTKDAPVNAEGWRTVTVRFPVVENTEQVWRCVRYRRHLGACRP